MARKYDFISELYNRTCKTVVANPASWEAFLRSACYNYRLRFDEQLLVHAQRPDATAVLQIDDWNKKFGRWVNRGAHGIAVFEEITPALALQAADLFPLLVDMSVILKRRAKSGAIFLTCQQAIHAKQTLFQSL